MCGEHLVTFSSTTRESIPTLIYKEIFNSIVTVANVLHETLRNVSLTDGDYYDYNNEILNNLKMYVKVTFLSDHTRHSYDREEYFALICSIYMFVL